MARAQIEAAVAAKIAGDKGLTIEEVSRRQTADGVEARSVSARIKTVDDLLRHIEADMSRFEVAASEASAWEGLTADKATGQPVIAELHRVFVRLRPKAGPTPQELVGAMIDAAKADLRRPPRKAKAKPARGGWAVLVVADVHYGKYCWKRSTGEADYDLDIAATLVRDASAELLELLAKYRPARITVATLGDLFHYDTPAGTTTGGTPLERDGRLQKMIQVGSDSLLSVFDAAADVAPCDGLVVNGNHDETLTWAFARILGERFRGDRRIKVDPTYTSRKYLEHGRNLLGFCHGNKAKRKLPQLMAIEAPQLWARCPYREIHTGHLHHQAAEWSRPIETIDAVLVRVAPSLGPADDYHAVNGWVGQRRAMEGFFYDEAGGLVAMHVAGPKFQGKP